MTQFLNILLVSLVMGSAANAMGVATGGGGMHGPKPCIEVPGTILGKLTSTVEIGVGRDSFVEVDSQTVTLGLQHGKTGMFKVTPLTFSNLRIDRFGRIKASTHFQKNVSCPVEISIVSLNCDGRSVVGVDISTWYSEFIYLSSPHSSSCSQFAQSYSNDGPTRHYFKY